MNEEANKETFQSDMSGTKLQIFRAAVDLFYERGYANVGIRDIADTVGIKSASIYNHFESKDALLEQIYKYFCDNYFNVLPSLDDIVARLPELSPLEAFELMNKQVCDKSTFELLRKIVVIAEYECNNRARAREVIAELFSVNTWRISTLLSKMVDAGVIEPVDVDIFASILVRFGFSSASHIEDLRNISVAEWRGGHRLLFNLVTKKK